MSEVHRSDRDPIPPSQRGLTVFEIDFVGDVIDDEGRPLQESKAPPYLQALLSIMGTSMETRACPYRRSPSRFGKLMDYAALQQVQQHRDAMWGGLAYMRDVFDTYEGPFTPTVDHLKKVGSMVSALPRFLILRAEEPVAVVGELPGFIASMSKAIEGINGFIRAEATKPNNLNTVITPAGLLEAVEKKGLVGSNRVCPAPPNLIHDTVAALISGEVDPDVKEYLNKLLPDLRDFVLFSQRYDQYETHTRIYKTIGQAFEIVAAKDHWSLERKEEERENYAQIQEAYTNTMNNLQPEMNLLLGRFPTAPRLTPRDVQVSLGVGAELLFTGVIKVNE
jgi:hypothetical protein